MRALRNLSIAILAVIALLITARALVIKIEPGFVGVLNAEWTGGLVEADYAPGYHLDVGPLHTWIVFDTTVQTLHMKESLWPGEEGFGSLQIKSADGANVALDVSVKYRPQKDRVWTICKSQGPGQTLDSGYKLRVKDKVRDTLVSELGGIRTEEFYDTDKRNAVSRQMEATLRTALAEIQVDMIAILIRDVRFQAAFEERIKQKALAEERIELNLAETKSEDYRGRTAKIETETAAKVVVIDQEREKQITTMRAENNRKIEQIRADYARRVTEVESDADLYAAKKDADGTRLVKEAEARGQHLRREALATAGGDNLVALEFATRLQLGEMSISTQQVDPLDIDAMMERFGAK